jgi:hypothetical protein
MPKAYEEKLSNLQHNARIPAVFGTNPSSFIREIAETVQIPEDFDLCQTF